MSNKRRNKTAINSDEDSDEDHELSESSTLKAKLL